MLLQSVVDFFCPTPTSLLTFAFQIIRFGLTAFWLCHRQVKNIMARKTYMQQYAQNIIDIIKGPHEISKNGDPRQVPHLPDPKSTFPEIACSNRFCADAEHVQERPRTLRSLTYTFERFHNKRSMKHRRETLTKMSGYSAGSSIAKSSRA